MATIKDVAAAAGVSVSTASRALNDNPRISTATVAKVKAAAAQLNYQPNRLARTLSTGEARMVGAIFPVTGETAPANPFQLDIIRGANSLLADRDYVLATAICQDEESLLHNVRAMVEQAKIHNFLVLYTKQADPVTAYLRKTGQNFVIIGQPAEEEDRYINNDNVLAGQKATHHLCADHRVHQPVLIRSANGWAYELDRERGFRAELAQYGRVPLVFQLTVDDPTAFFAAHPEVDGLLATDDISMLTFFNQLGSAQLRAPLTWPAVCFNRSRLLSLASPQVDKVDMLPRQLGARAVDLLFDRQRTHQLVGFKILEADEAESLA